MKEHKLLSVNCASITILPDRQRSLDESETQDLDDSIKAKGVFQPIVLNEIENNLFLVAGFRRLSSSIKVGRETIPAIIYSNLSPLECETIELEENIQHRPLIWQDKVLAIGRLHNNHKTLYPNWSLAKTASRCFQAEMTISRAIKIYQYKDNPTIFSASSQNRAVELIEKLERASTKSLDDLLSSVTSEVVKRTTNPVKSSGEISILESSLESWINSYSGPQFNLLHMDGEILENVKLISRFTNKLLLPSCHIILWVHTSHISSRVELLSKFLPQFTIDPNPLIWVQTNTTGKNYLSAIFGSSEDRKLVNSLDYSYASPRYSQDDFSEPMLRHFFKSFVNEVTSVFDPYCRCGSSIFAAHDLGAKHSLGLTQGDLYLTAKSTLSKRKAEQLFKGTPNVAV